MVRLTLLTLWRFRVFVKGLFRMRRNTVDMIVVLVRHSIQAFEPEFLPRSAKETLQMPRRLTHNKISILFCHGVRLGSGAAGNKLSEVRPEYFGRGTGRCGKLALPTKTAQKALFDGGLPSLFHR
jgi:hypothetical protein